MYVCWESPEKSPPTYIQERHKVTIHGAPRRQKAYIHWGADWFPKGIINDTAICTPVPCSLWHDTSGGGTVPSFSDSNVVHFEYLFLLSSYVILFVRISDVQVTDSASRRRWSPAWRKRAEHGWEHTTRLQTQTALLPESQKSTAIARLTELRSQLLKPWYVRVRSSQDDISFVTTLLHRQ